ncbi:Calx-beta domain-containing protein [Maribacter sp. Asnod1-A12]|uniref:Calx-beta domain-containing protein n=1 Tax=Maribacter sp. Asnod1-A12 TaxID=3160576 RepID=UPI00386BE55E
MKKTLMYLSVAALLFSCTKTEEIEVEKIVEVPTAIDLSKVSLASSESMTTESDEQVIIISAAIEAAQEDAVTIQLNFAGSAVLNSDYSISSSSITIPAGELTGTTELTIISDGVFESGVENIVISLAELSNTITPSESESFVQIDITDGEALLGFETSSITIEENSFYSLNFNLSKPLNEDIVVYYSSNTGNSRYSVEGDGELIIQAGQSSKSVTVDANDDRITASGEKSITVTIDGVENDDVTIGSIASIEIATTEINEGLQINSTWSTQSNLFELSVTDSNGDTVESSSSSETGSESLFINRLDSSPLTNGTYAIELIASQFDALTSETVNFSFLDEVEDTYSGPYTFIANNRFIDGKIAVFELEVLDGVYTITQVNTSN